MVLYNMYYPCKCGTRHIRREYGETVVTDDMKTHVCDTCGRVVELEDVSQW